ncbi:3-deoxy-D-manno-octulosonic acid transferase [Tenacibaculum todarodis]|uniref:3-deoxy-D-manno-octulosonic acid transferase n=1 Tax=Tenacibaculum todarodis TaxID=1850252 RepID=A0A1L3JKC1_9FLAO|nr:glycosyltransferase N-terminal domain-containing protein [Tenacibaculum todarodis]APG65595.1 3-deoxy-D-manno-octulosonic acid transferase [Tenacibaculum todarodis]
MNFLYNILVFIASLLLPLIALFNKKIKLFVDGRKETFTKLSSINKTDKVIWFHAASLGEFEQAIPIIEELKNKYDNYKIVVTFFSPSGYEIRKNYALADIVCYLPLDSKSKMKKLLEIVHPTVAIFIKYEFWPNLLSQLKRKEIPTILVSGILREKQSFFKWYGGFMREKLNTFNHFFVQNEESKKLLKSINLNNVTIAGDTRFDRVSTILNQDNRLDFISEFKNSKYVIVAGSTWQEDEELLVNYINNEASEEEKFIIAPHNINQKNIEILKNSILKKTVLFSAKGNTSLAEYQVFIIDTIGILTKIYSYADTTYVGGGLKTGLHNILEPATFGVPIVIGNKYKKFKEAEDLVALKGCISINNQEEFSTIFTKFKADENYRKSTGNINKKYIQENLGATPLVVNYLKNIL